MYLRRLLCVAVTLVVACNSEEPEPAAPAPAPLPATEAPAPEPAAPPAPQQPARRVVEVQGKVTLDGAPVTPDMELPATGTLETGKDGRALLTLGKGSIIEVRKSSKVKLGSSTRKKSSFELVTGTLWSFLAKGESYEVVTGNAVAGVRGTIFYVEAHKHDTYICACDGEVELQAGAELPRNVVSEMGHVSTNVKGKGRKAKSKPAKLKGHTKEQAAALLEKLAEIDAQP